MRIGITFNLKSEVVSAKNTVVPEDAAEEFDLPETIEAIQKVLEHQGHEVFPLGGGLGILEKIKKSDVEFVFNIAEGLEGRSREAHIPALLEMAGIPYSGSDPLGLALTLDKALTKRIALSLDIPTPEFWVVNSQEEVDQIPARFPFFVKPLWEGSSKGIRFSSRVDNPGQLNKEIHRLFDHYGGGPALVEEYVPGREVTVGILGNHPPGVLGAMEITFRDPEKKDFYYSLEVKRNWREWVEYHAPTRLGGFLEKKIEEAALRLFETLRLRDVARFDFRVSPDGQFYFLETNPLPGLNPESGDLVILARKKSWSYEELILKIARSAFERYPRLKSWDHRKISV